MFDDDESDVDHPQPAYRQYETTVSDLTWPSRVKIRPQWPLTFNLTLILGVKPVYRILNWPHFNFKKASLSRFWPTVVINDHSTIFVSHKKHNHRWWQLYKNRFNRFWPVQTGLNPQNREPTLLPLTDKIWSDFCKNNLSFQPIIIKSPDSGINRIFHDNQVHKNKNPFYCNQKS